MCTPCVLLQSAGQFGNPEIRCALIKKLIKNPLEIVIHACALIEFWAGLYTPELQGQLAAGVNIILSWAHRVLARQVHTTPPLLHQAVMDTAAVAERNQEDDVVAQAGNGLVCN